MREKEEELSPALHYLHACASPPHPEWRMHFCAAANTLRRSVPLAVIDTSGLLLLRWYSTQPLQV
jgi:hypothetical protein